MLLDFSDMAADASQKGMRPLMVFCLRELIDFPASLLQAYWREGSMVKVLRSQPVNYGFRAAFGFGVIFPLAIVIANLVQVKLQSPVDDSPILNLEFLYFVLFQTTHGVGIVRWLPGALSSLIIGLLLGGVFAFLCADRSKYLRYVLVIMLCWYLRGAVYDVLWYSTDLVLFLGTRHDIYLEAISSVLSGAFLGLIPYVAKSEGKGSLRMLILGAFGYPLIASLYLQLLFRIPIIQTPWMFIALLILIMIYIGSVFLIAVKSESSPKLPWLVIAGVVGYFLLPPVGSFLTSLLRPLIDSIMFLAGVSIYGILYGALYGLLFGVLLGFHKKNGISEMKAGT